MKQSLKYILDLQDGSFSSGMKNAEGVTGALDRQINKVAVGLATAFAGNELFNKGKEAVDVSRKMQGLDNILKFASKNTLEYQQNQDWLNKTINDFALPKMESEDGFGKLLSTFKNVEGGVGMAKETFKGLAAAQTVMHLTTEQSSRATYALVQMMGKGKVSSEELRQQLGDVLPNAFELAAKSAGVTTAKFDKMLQNGEVMSKDFLPRFAKELQNFYGPGVQNALDSFQSKENLINNSLIDQQNIVGTQLQPAYLALQKVQLKGWEIASGLLDVYKEHKNTIDNIALAAGLATGAYILYNGVQKVGLGLMALQKVAMETQIWYTLAVESGLGKAAAAQTALNLAMSLNPIGLVIVALGGLAFAIKEIIDLNNTLDAQHKSTMYKQLDTTAKAEREELKKEKARLLKENPKLSQKDAEFGAVKNRRNEIEESQRQTERIFQKTNFGTEENEVARRAKTLLTMRHKVTYENKADLFGNGEFNTANTKPSKSTSGSLPAGNTTSAGLSGGSHSGGKSEGRSVVVHIQNLVKDINISNIASTMSVREMERIITQAVVRSVRDFENVVE